ncbi:MAG: hypothetical protein ACR2H0_06895 [Candidatus Limnocylindrales bacterium]
MDYQSSPRELPARIECPWCGSVELFEEGTAPLYLDGVYARSESEDTLPPEAYIRRERST